MKMHKTRSFQYPLLNMGRLVLMCLVTLTANSLAGASPLTQRIIIGTFSPHFSPQFVQVNMGTSITWKNPTSAVHSITHDECLTSEPCLFDSGPIGPNQTFSLAHLPPGSYPYHCSFHPIMQGILVVLPPDHSQES